MKTTIGSVLKKEIMSTDEEIELSQPDRQAKTSWLSFKRYKSVCANNLKELKTNESNQSTVNGVVKGEKMSQLRHRGGAMIAIATDWNVIRNRASGFRSNRKFAA